jgi:hypothetical protein
MTDPDRTNGGEPKPAQTALYTETVIETPDEPVRRRFEDLPPAAQRALREAEARRREIDARAQALQKEIDGRGGLEPTRYEDWEVKGITSDF